MLPEPIVPLREMSREQLAALTTGELLGLMKEATESVLLTDRTAIDQLENDWDGFMEYLSAVVPEHAPDQHHSEHSAESDE
jgi:hypothetical protein